MFSRSGFVLALVASALTVACASDFAHKNVVALTDATFEEKTNDGGVWFVKFYAPWCGHCKRLGPDWGKLGDAVKSEAKINIATVDCTVHKDVCSKFEVRGYPTLKVLSGGVEIDAYKGSRELSALESYIKKTAKETLSETVA